MVQPGLCRTWSETPNTGFLTTKLNCNRQKSSSIDHPSPNTDYLLVAVIKQSRQLAITKTNPCNEHPFTPHFYIVKLGFTRVYIFSYFCPKHRLWILVRTASLTCTHNQCFEQILEKNIINFHLKMNIYYSREVLLYIARACLRNADIR